MDTKLVMVITVAIDDVLDAEDFLRDLLDSTGPVREYEFVVSKSVDSREADR